MARPSRTASRQYAALIAEAAGRLGTVTDAPHREAAQLLAQALGLERRSDLHLTRGDEAPQSETRVRFERLVGERARGVPLQYVLGHVDFYESRLRVRPGVFIPRPETEALVDAVLDVVPERGRVLELGTGSGAVVASVLLQRPAVRAAAVDVSPAALVLARENAAALGIGERVAFHEGDLYTPLRTDAVFDVIVSNPPYVATSDALPPEVHEHEPHMALYAGGDGLACIRRIVSGAPARLEPGGWLVLEIGETQGDPVRSLLAVRGFEGVHVDRDLSRKERIARGRWPSDRMPG